MSRIPNDLQSSSRTVNPMRLGICCVYFYGPDGEWLLPLQLRFISETLAGYTYKIYAAANRLDPELLSVLSQTQNVEVVDLPHFEGRANSEHAHYLDRLLQHACADGCTHLAALDSDSFPICNDWPNILLARMKDRARIAAVLRAENDDTHLPHPCGYFMTREFYEERHPELFPEPNRIAAPEFQAFLQRTRQRVDTGIGYGYVLWKTKEQWLPLVRSNSQNPHFLMAGVYGDIFFHLGSSSRRPAFFLDYKSRLSLRLAHWLRHMPLAWRVSEKIERQYMEKNEEIFNMITTRLKSDPKLFFSELRGSGS